MAAFKLVDVIETHNQLGEGALWHPGSECLWWTDIQDNVLFCYHPADQTLERFAAPLRICSFAFTPDPACLLTAFESGLARFYPGTGDVKWLFRPEFPAPHIRFNDGHTDRQGRFWVGTMVEGLWPPPQLGRLYCLHPDGTVETHAETIGITNAICTSPDGKSLYFADSARQQIYICDLNPENGKIDNQRPFASTEGNIQPDGAIADAAGYIWNAEWDGSRITRYTPDGDMADQFPLPVSRPTSLAFGGKKKNLLFVTSAQDGLTPDALQRQPMAGNVLIFETDMTGISDAAFN